MLPSEGSNKAQHLGGGGGGGGGTLQASSNRKTQESKTLILPSFPVSLQPATDA